MEEEKKYWVYWIGKGMLERKRDNTFPNPVNELTAIKHCKRLNYVYKDLLWSYEETTQ